MSRDYEEFLASLNESGARYLIVGAHAVAYHVLPRSTRDLDVYIEPAPENAERVLIAIRQFFGGNDLGFTVADLTDRETIVQLGVAPARIDLLSALASHLEFSALWDRRVNGKYRNVETHYISMVSS